MWGEALEWGVVNSGVERRPEWTIEVVEGVEGEGAEYVDIRRVGDRDIFALTVEFDVSFLVCCWGWMMNPVLSVLPNGLMVIQSVEAPRWFCLTSKPSVHVRPIIPLPS